MLNALQKFWPSFKLLLKADRAFAMVSRDEDERALEYLKATEKALGPLTQYTFGIEPRLLEIYLKGCLTGIGFDDYDWVALRDSIVSASEYNSAEKLHLLVYLEELAATAGVSLSMSDILNRPAPTERIRPQLKRRFPKLSDA